MRKVKANESKVSEEKATPSHERIKGLVQIGLALLITIAVLLATPYIESFKQLGYLGAFLISLLSSATVIIPAPGWAFVLAMGRTLDPLMLGVVAGIGAGIGELTGYMIGYGGTEILDGKNAQYRKNSELVRKYDVIAIFVLAALPNPIFDLAGIAAGALRMPLWKFLLACIAGKILKFVLIAYFGVWSTAIF